jgi:hypothetical protein
MLNGSHMEAAITSHSNVPDMPRKPRASTETPNRTDVTVATATGNLRNTSQNRLTQLVRINNLIIVVVNTAVQAKFTSSETPRPCFCECVCDHRPPPNLPDKYPRWRLNSQHVVSPCSPEQLDP